MQYAPAASEFAVYKRRSSTAKVMRVISGVSWSLGMIGFILDDEDTLNGNGWDYAISGLIGTGLATGIWGHYARKSADKRLNRSIDLYNAQF